MKKRFILLIFLLTHLLSASMLSQEPDKGKTGDRGLYLGMSTSNFAGSDASAADNKYLPGLVLGFYQDFDLGQRYCLETGLLFTSKGSRLESVGDLYLHQVLTYMELPLLLDYKLVQAEKLDFFILGGAFLGLKLLAFNEVGFPDDINGLDLGLITGLGVRFRHFSCRMDVKRGFLSIDKSESPRNYKNLTFSLLMGISF